MLLEDVEGQSSWICVAVLKWTEAVVAAVSLSPTYCEGSVFHAGAYSPFAFLFAVFPDWVRLSLIAFHRKLFRLYFFQCFVSDNCDAVEHYRRSHTAAGTLEHRPSSVCCTWTDFFLGDSKNVWHSLTNEWILLQSCNAGQIYVSHSFPHSLNQRCQLNQSHSLDTWIIDNALILKLKNLKNFSVCFYFFNKLP